MSIFAIDPSLTASGVCYDVGDDQQQYDEIKPKKLRGVERLDHIHAHLYDIVTERHPRDKIRWAVMEGYNYGAARGRKGFNQSMGRLFDIGELGGMIKMFFHDDSIPLLIVPPASLKMFVTGNGSAQKDQMIAAVAKQWGVETNSDNIADAVGLYHFMRAYMGARARRRYSEKQRSALAGAKYNITY
jgi:Holliday junction resolvasome RuvABC endonuclease subunit